MDLFVYGTLLFPEVLRALLDRVPAGEPAAAPGWRVAALAGRLYPGLVPHRDGHAAGLVLTGLAEDEVRLLDAYEDTDYRLTEIALAGGRRCATYVWRLEALPHGWSRDAFATDHLAGYVELCTRWRAGWPQPLGGAPPSP